MPRYKIERSLFEPVTIEVEGGRTYESAELSPRLIREVSELDEQRKAGTLEGDVYVVQAVALIFGLKPEEIETTDIRLLSRMLTLATDAMGGGKAGKAAEAASSEAAEATAEKNGQKPGSEPSP